MKKIIATLCSALLLSACGDTSTEKIEILRTTVDRQAMLTNDGDAPQCIVHMELDYLPESYGTVAKSINNSIVHYLFDLEELSVAEAADSFANKYIYSYQHDFAPLYREDRADKSKRAWYEYRYNLSTETRQESAAVLNYLITLEYYEGGAHGISQLLAMNFNTKTGQLYKLSDLFVPGYEQRLNERLLKALMEQTEAKNLDQLREKGYLFSMDIFAPENFIIGSDAITFIYNPYEIAAYALGKTQLTIDNDELEDIMQKEHDN